jgi:hypothetical protein
MGIFASRAEAQMVIKAWRRDYKEERSSFRFGC